MRILTAVLLSAAVMVASSVKSYASDADDVKAATEALHAAIASLDMSKMDPLWAHDATVTLINPRDKTVPSGWDAVKKNWETAFSVFSELKVTQADGPHIHVKGDVAWSTGIANAASKTKAGVVIANTPTFETDVFEKRDGKWLLVSHVALSVPQ